MITDADQHIYDAFGALVREHRVEHQLTQELVAKHLQLTRASVSNIESGRQRLQLHQVMALADLFHVDPCELIPSLPQSRIIPEADLDSANREIARIFVGAAGASDA